MTDDTATELHTCLERLRAGDSEARSALVARAYERLRQMAHQQMPGFDRLRPLVDTDDVLQNAVLRLMKRLAVRTPADPVEFLTWAAREIRCELLDLIRSRHGPLGAGRWESPGVTADPGQTTFEPTRLARWAELHEQVERLPEDERQVFDLLWYHGLTRPAAAVFPLITWSGWAWVNDENPIGNFLVGACRPINWKVPDAAVGNDASNTSNNNWVRQKLSSMSSGHSGGANVGFADGSVRFLTDGTDITVLWALATRASGEVVNPQP